MARKKSHIHYIYKTTCLITGRWYIGMHSTCNLNDGYMGSGKRLRYSIRKHGIENHIKEILEYFESREELIKKEREIVTLDLIKDNLCMNIKEGGTGGLSGLSDELIRKIRYGASEHQKKMWKDEIYKNKIIKLLSDYTKKAHISGKIKYDNFKNKKHSNESKILMRESHKNKHVGDKNSQYGTCWITKDGINKKIKKEELNKWINEGWINGRKIKLNGLFV